MWRCIRFHQKCLHILGIFSQFCLAARYENCPTYSSLESGAALSSEPEAGKVPEPEPEPTSRAMREKPLLPPFRLFPTMSMVTSLRRLERLPMLAALAGIAEGEVPAVDWAAVDR